MLKTLLTAINLAMRLTQKKILKKLVIENEYYFLECKRH